MEEHLKSCNSYTLATRMEANNRMDDDDGDAKLQIQEMIEDLKGKF